MSYIREQGAALARQGYKVVPIWSVLAETKDIPKEKKLDQYKAPVGDDWQNHPLSEKECAEYRMPRCGCGVLCGVGDVPVVAIDCDIDGDSELATAIRIKFNEVLGFDGVCPIRYGKRPKFLIVGRMDPDNRHTKMLSSKYSRDGKETSVQIEVLGVGQQFVTYGIHPGTQKPYEWEPNYIGEGLEDFPPASLPVFTQDKIRQCIDIFERTVEARDEYKKVSHGSVDPATVSNEAWTNVVPDKPPVGMKPEFIRQMLKELIEEEQISIDNYEEWSRVGMALHHEFKGSEEGLALWDELSQSADKYNGIDDLRQHWESFGNYRGEVLTLKSYQSKWLSLDRYAYNESGIMNRVLRTFGSQFCYVDEINRFREYNAPVWSNISEARARYYAMMVIEHGLVSEAKKLQAWGMGDRASELLSYRAKCRYNTNRTCGNVIRDIQSQAGIHIDKFDSDPNLFAVGNGVIRLSTKEFLPPAPEYMISHGSSVHYDENARNERWEQFVSEVCDGDMETVDYLQRAVGYAMSGVPNRNVMFFLLGRGCNGKSVFINTISKVFGTYHKAVPADYMTQSLKSFSGSGKAADPVLVSMAGSRLCVSSETALGASLQEEVVKKLASMDEMSGRGLYSGDMHQIIPSWVFFIGTNHFPDIRGTDKGIWRRIRVVDFAVDFDDGNHVMDPYLEEKLARDLPGILNWCLEGFQKYKENGIEPSQKAIEATQRVHEQSDVVGLWINERCRVGQEKTVLLKDAYRSWCSWAAVNSEVGRYPNNKIFAQVLSDYGFKKTRVSSGYRFFGFELLTDEELTAMKEAEELED